MRTALSALLTFAAIAPAVANDAWRPLPLIENGKVAPGWKHTGFGGFSVVGDTLRTDGDPRGLGLLVYEKEKLGDCRIRVVYRTEDGKDNAGVYVRIADGILTAKPAPAAERDASGELTPAGQKAMEEASATHAGPWYAVHHGYEVQICDDADAHHRTGAIYSLAQADEAPEKSPGEWRTMVITLDGNEVRVELDGKQVSTFDPAGPVPARKIWHEPEREHERPGVGYIGLQNHDPGDTVYFKEVSVSPLPPTSR